MNCAASKALLTLCVLNDLDQATVDTVRTHLDSCSDCRAALQDIDSTLGLLRDALAAPTGAPRHLAVNRRLKALEARGHRGPPVTVSHESWFTRHHRGLAAAAAAVFIVGMIGLIMPATRSARRQAFLTQTMMADHDVKVEALQLDEIQALGPERELDLDADDLLEQDRAAGSEWIVEEAPEPVEMGWESADSPKPATFDSVAMVKSPVIMQGIFGSRSAGQRGKALAQYGGASGQDTDEISADFYGANGAATGPPATSVARCDQKESQSKAKGVGGSISSGDDIEPGKKGMRRHGMDRALPGLADYRAEDGRERSVVEGAMRSRLELEAEAEAEETKRLSFTAYGVNPFVVTRTEPFSTFGIDVDTASYTLTRYMMAQGTLPPAEAVRTEEFVNAFDYGHVAPSHRTFRIYTELAPSPFGRGHQMLKIGVKGRRLGREEQRPAVLTFLVDTSGSMNAPERIGLVRKSLRLLVENLAPRDQVAVIQYDSHARLLLEHTPASNRARILQAIDRMQCSGSTNLEEGMHEAYRLAAAGFIGGAENRVLLLSDGVANLGSIAAGDILAKVAAYRKQGIFCSVFGVGSGSYDDTMLETLANKGDGVYTFLDSEEQARRVFVDDLAATLNTIASDVKIQVEFNPMVVSQYRQLGYENRRLKKEDFRNDAVDAGEVGSGQSVTALYELSLLPQLLAKTRIDLPPRTLATVRVRYRRIDTGRVEEIEKAVRPHECVPVLDKASNGFRLAAAVAEFAELLRGSPHARGSSYEDVAHLLRPVALELHLDKRVQELLQMVMAAESTPRGE